MRNGFTLIELLVVIVILGLIAAVVAVNVSERAERAKRDLTVTALARLEGEVDLYRIHENRLPAGLEELVRVRQLKEVPKDGWGREFIYRPSGSARNSFDLLSYGADGQPGGTGWDTDLWSSPQK